MSRFRVFKVSLGYELPIVYYHDSRLFSAYQYEPTGRCEALR